MVPDLPDMPPQIDTAYGDAIDNLIFLKRQQWWLTNQSLIIQAAIFLALKEAAANITAVLQMLSVVTVVLSVISIWVFQKSMTKFRKRLSYIYDTYMPNLRGPMQLHATGSSSLSDPFVPLMLSIVCAVACGVVLAYKW